MSKLDPAGRGSSDLVYSTYLGGTGNCDEWAFLNGNCHDIGKEGGRGIALGPAVVKGGPPTVYVTGYTGSSDDFPTTQGAFQSSLGGCSQANVGRTECDAFVTRLNPAGGDRSDLVYSTYLGGGDIESGSAIAVDGSGNALVTGWTQASTFPTKSPIQATCGCFFGANDDAFVAKLNPTQLGDGSGEPSPSNPALAFSTFVGGAGDDYGNGIAAGPAGSVYVAGRTNSPGNPSPEVQPLPYPTTKNAFQRSLRGGSDAFVSKISGP